MAYTVGEVARLARVSVRTLHHYDEIGLVRASGRTKAKYRLYTDRDLERLQQVLFYRELGFKLEDVAAILADPAFDRKKALLGQRALVVGQIERARSLLRLIDRSLESIEGGKPMTKEEMFDDFDPSKYQEEAERRWGKTGAYAESKRRTKSYTKEDWARMKEEQARIVRAFADAAEQGTPATDARAMDIAEEHRRLIDKWFYPCSRQMHAALGQMYVDDPRFAAFYDAHRPGLAAYVSAAVRANAAR
jgi:DNA-binding transcriptional MerR regulator